MADYVTDPLRAERLQRYMDSRGLTYWGNSRSWILKCPVCHKSDKLYILKSGTKFVCWFCRETPARFQGRPEFAFHEMTGESVSRIRAELMGADEPLTSVGISISFDDWFGTEDEDVPIEVAKPIVVKYWPFHCLKLDRPGAEVGRTYLESRQVAWQLAAQYDVRYSPELRSVAFPVSIEQQMVGWQYRCVDPTVVVTEEGEVFERIKSPTEKDTPRDRGLLFEHRLVGSPHAIVLEGPFDALKMHGAGGNIATMGAAVTPDQVALIARSGIQRVYIGIDPDAASSVDPLVEKFMDLGVEAYRVTPPEGIKDLGALAPDVACSRIRFAEKLKRGQIHVHFKLPSSLR